MLRAQAPAAYALGVIRARRACSGCVGQAQPDLLVAVSVQGDLDGFAHPGVERFGTAELANPLLRFARSEMARPGRPMLDLPIGRKTKPLLRAFVCLLLGHGRISEPIRS